MANLLKHKCMPVLSLVMLFFSMTNFSLAETGSLEMRVTLEKDAKNVYSIRVGLRNTTSDPIEVDRATLPWRAVDPVLSLTISSLTGQATQLKRGYPVVDYKKGIFKLRLLPGEELSGELLLSPVFDDLDAGIQEHGIRIDWECRVKSAREGELLKVVCPLGQAGSFEIPKGNARLK